MVNEDITIMQGYVQPGDPHICSDSSNRLSILNSIYDTLVIRGSDGLYYPSLAETWDTSRDAKTWRFQLRKNVEFHNGDILDSQDVVATLNRVIDPSIGGAYGTQGVYAGYIGDSKIEALNDNSVQITTNESMADLLDLIMNMPISPESEIEQLPDEHIGTGPYYVEDRSRSETNLTAFDNHFLGVPTCKSLRWIAKTDSNKRAESLLSKEADISANIGVNGKDFIENNKTALVRDYDSHLCIIFMFNIQKGVCTDKRVRQALNNALNIETIISEIKKGAANPLASFITPRHYGYNPSTSTYNYDTKKAKKLLTEAGYGNGVSLIMDIPTTMPDEAIPLSKIMTTFYENIGVQIEVKQHYDRAAYAEMVRDKKINDLCCFDSSPLSTFRVLREKIHSGLKGPWWQGYSNPQVDSLIKQAQSTINYNAREKIYRRIYQIIHDDAPWVFLYRPTNFWGVRNDFSDWKPSSTGLTLFR